MAESPRPVAEPQERPKQGGHASATLNHLASSSPRKEYADLVREEEELLERLERVMRDRARHELHLRLAGVSREELLDAIRTKGDA